MLHKGFSCLLRSRGRQNIECTILLPSISVAVILLDATASAIFFFKRTFSSKRFIRKVLPVSPGALIKNVTLLIIFNVVQDAVVNFFSHRPVDVHFH